MEMLVNLRPLFIDIIILGSLLVYDWEYNKLRDGKSYYHAMGIAAFVFVILGMMIQIMINLEISSSFLHQAVSKIYLITALVYSLFYSDYIFANVTTRKIRQRIHLVELSIGLLVIAVSCYLPIGYARGEVTNYNIGLSLTICFGYACLLFLIVDAVVIVYRKKFSNMFVGFIIGSSLFAFVFIALKLVYPEFLFVESQVTILTILVFFQIEAPVDKLQNRAFLDIDTGTFNKNCFDWDVEQDKSLQDGSLSLIMCDINHLKYINDHYGHLKGDSLLAAAAQVISRNVTGKLYRMGGDEFLAVLNQDDEEEIQAMIDRIHHDCKKWDTLFDGGLSIAMGYAVRRRSESVMELLQMADMNMYEIKEAMKQQMDAKYYIR